MLQMPAFRIVSIVAQRTCRWQRTSRLRHLDLPANDMRVCSSDVCALPCRPFRLGQSISLSSAGHVLGPMRRHPCSRHVPRWLQCLRRRATWSTAASQAEVAADLARVLKATHSDPAEKLQWSMALTKQTSTELWSERKTEKAGFVDLQTFSLTANSSGTGTTIVATSRSRDYNMWTSCSCLKNECGRWIACFLCCCGICPTKDWGANKELLTVRCSHILALCSPDLAARAFLAAAPGAQARA